MVCLPPQAVLQQLAEDMFPEGKGKPNASAKLSKDYSKTNGLVLNASTAIFEFFKARGYETRKPEKTKQKLGSRWTSTRRWRMW